MDSFGGAGLRGVAMQRLTMATLAGPAAVAVAAQFEQWRAAPNPDARFDVPRDMPRSFMTWSRPMSSLRAFFESITNNIVASPTAGTAVTEDAQEEVAAAGANKPAVKEIP